MTLELAPPEGRDGDVIDGRRVESDSMGKVLVPADRLWGAQTQRSLEHFDFPGERMPLEVVHALARVKGAAARVNERLAGLDGAVAAAISAAASEVVDGALDDQFPLVVWQTGSGTQSNMNVNEVIANRAIQMMGGTLGTKKPVHPNDHVNRSQSSNDAFPTAVHVATALAVNERFVPAVEALIDVIEAKATEWADVVKLGRTHLQDATPLTVGQEWWAWATQLSQALASVVHAMDAVLELAIGGTAVGTGLNAPAGFGDEVAAVLASETGLAFRGAPNRFAGLAGAEAMVGMSGALRGFAVALHKVADDTRWLGSGPRAGLHELVLPENEPGSSIMPGKVNPTQQEAAIMVALQVMALDSAVAAAGSQGHFQLNTLRPLIAENVLRSVRLLVGAVEGLRLHCMDGIELDRARIDRYVGGSAMLVTALSPIIGYDKAAAIAHDSLVRDVSLREAALTAGVSAEQFDEVVDPRKMLGPS
jgi:fumarate hydratase class II